MKNEAKKECKGSGQGVERALQAGLCVSIYKGVRAVSGHSGYDLVYVTGCVTIALQLAIAIIPLALTIVRRKVGLSKRETENKCVDEKKRESTCYCCSWSTYFTRSRRPCGTYDALSDFT